MARRSAYNVRVRAYTRIHVVRAHGLYVTRGRTDARADRRKYLPRSVPISFVRPLLSQPSFSPQPPSRSHRLRRDNHRSPRPTTIIAAGCVAGPAVVVVVVVVAYFRCFALASKVLSVIIDRCSSSRPYAPGGVSGKVSTSRGREKSAGSHRPISVASTTLITTPCRRRTTIELRIIIIIIARSRQNLAVVVSRAWGPEGPPRRPRALCACYYYAREGVKWPADSDVRV